MLEQHNEKSFATCYLPTKSVHTVYIDDGMPHRPGIASEILTQRPDSDVGNTSMQDVMHERCHRLTTAAGQQHK